MTISLCNITGSLDTVYPDFQKVFGRALHNKLIFKVTQIGIAGNVHNWTKNWLNNRKQRVVINRTASD